MNTTTAVPCAERTCPNTIHVDLRHVDNLAGRWICPDHPKENDR